MSLISSKTGWPAAASAPFTGPAVSVGAPFKAWEEAWPFGRSARSTLRRFDAGSCSSSPDILSCTKPAISLKSDMRAGESV